jgi:hypothetical protein
MRDGRPVASLGALCNDAGSEVDFDIYCAVISDQNTDCKTARRLKQQHRTCVSVGDKDDGSEYLGCVKSGYLIRR